MLSIGRGQVLAFLGRVVVADRQEVVGAELPVELDEEDERVVGGRDLSEILVELVCPPVSMSQVETGEGFKVGDPVMGNSSKLTKYGIS